MANEFDHFKSILKKKGTGKTMSKHMDIRDIEFVLKNYSSDLIPMCTKSTLLTAWMMLEQTLEEQNGLEQLVQNKNILLPEPLWYLLDPSDSLIDQSVHSAMLGVETSMPTICAIFDDYFNGKIPNYKLASFLEALRLKEETFQENTTIYDYFRLKSKQLDVNVPILIDIATPYDGFNRSYFLQPFVCALLAAIGIPSILHGVLEVSPKKGINTHKLLRASQKNPYLSMDQIKKQIENPSIGWGYIDQSVFCDTLHSLIPLRVDMVKRPVLATIEKWLQPFKAENTVCLTGFTHPPYKQKTLDIIDYAKSFNQLILVRGVEGSTLLPPDRRTPFITMTNQSKPHFDFCSSTDFNLEQTAIENQSYLHSLDIGMAGLSGKNKQIQNFLCYQVMAITDAINQPIQYNDLIQTIQSGKALSHWENAH